MLLWKCVLMRLCPELCFSLRELAILFILFGSVGDRNKGCWCLDVPRYLLNNCFQQMFVQPQKSIYKMHCYFIGLFYNISVDTECIIDGDFVICLIRYGIKSMPCFPYIIFEFSNSSL